MSRMMKVVLALIAALVGVAWYDGRLPAAIDDILGKGTSHKEGYSEFERDAGFAADEDPVP